MLYEPALFNGVLGFLKGASGKPTVGSILYSLHRPHVQSSLLLIYGSFNNNEGSQYALTCTALITQDDPQRGHQIMDTATVLLYLCLYLHLCLPILISIISVYRSIYIYEYIYISISISVSRNPYLHLSLHLPLHLCTYPYPYQCLYQYRYQCLYQYRYVYLYLCLYLYL